MDHIHQLGIAWLVATTDVWGVADRPVGGRRRGRPRVGWLRRRAVRPATPALLPQGAPRPLTRYEDGA
jgi:hypothetical protein